MCRCIASGFYKTILNTVRECNPIRNVLLYATYVIQLAATDSQHAFVVQRRSGNDVLLCCSAGKWASLHSLASIHECLKMSCGCCFRYDVLHVVNYTVSKLQVSNATNIDCYNYNQQSCLHGKWVFKRQKPGVTISLYNIKTLLIIFLPFW